MSQAEHQSIKTESLINTIWKKDLTAVKALLEIEPKALVFKDYEFSSYKPLVEAVGAGIDFVRLLLNHGCPVDDRNHSGKTALVRAVRDSSPIELIELLLTHGANVSIRDEDDLDAVSHAIYTENAEALSLILKSKSCNINTRDSQGKGYLDFNVLYSGFGETGLAVASLLLHHKIPEDHLHSALARAKEREASWKNLEGAKVKDLLLTALEHKALARVVDESVLRAGDDHRQKNMTDPSSKTKFKRL